MLVKCEQCSSLWVPVLLVFYNFFANLANDIYLPSMPKLVEVFLTHSSIVQFSMTAWFVGVALPQLFLGPLSERIGRRPVLLYGSACLLIATSVCAIAPTIWVLIIARFFQGVGVCSLNVTSFSILADLYNYKDRIRILNYLGMWGSLAPLLGPILGGYIFVWLGWQANFVLIFILILACVIGLWIELPESNKSLNPYALRIPILYKNYHRLFTNPNFIKHLVPYCLILSGSIVYMTAAPFIIINNIKIKPELFGFTQIPMFLAYLIGSLSVNYLARYYEAKTLIRFGMIVIMSGSIMMMILNLLLTNSLWGFIFPMVIYSLGFSLCSSSYVAELMSSASVVKGYAAAALGVSMAMGCVLSSLLLGISFNSTSMMVASIILIISLSSSFIYWRMS